MSRLEVHCDDSYLRRTTYFFVAKGNQFISESLVSESLFPGPGENITGFKRDNLNKPVLKLHLEITVTTVWNTQM